MGSTFLTIDEAARRLNRHRRSVANYLDKGLLKKIVRGRNVLIPAEDVEQLAIELGSDAPAMNRKSFLEMQSRLKKLEEKMAVFEAIWGAQEAPLRPNPKEAAGMWQAVRDYLSNKTYQFQELQAWAGLFNRIDETTLSAIADHALDPAPWRPYYDLVTRMLDHLDSKKELKTSLLLQACRAKMDAGKRKVREAALFWIESGRGTVPAALFKTLDTPKEDLLRSLTANTPKA